MDVFTRMSVMRLPGVLGASVDGPHFIGSVFAFNYPWWPAQDSNNPASAAVDHRVLGVPLAGNATLMVTVSLTVFSDFDDGRGIADFDTGLFGVGVPQVTLTVRPEPIMFIAQS